MRWLKRLFAPCPVHFHTMQSTDSGPVCGKRGGECEITRDGMHRVTCPGCKAWLEEHPTWHHYDTIKDWLYGGRK